MSEQKQWLNDANSKYESCAYACKRGLSGGCSLNGYPVIDCPTCNAYKEKKTEVQP